MREQDIFAHIDHTLLKPGASWKEIQTLCREALRFGAAAVCVPPSFVHQVKQAFPMLTVVTVVGFPLGYQSSGTKVYEAARAIADGADEIDIVINISDVKDMAYHRILAELKEVRATIGNKVLKAIVETCLLTEAEKIELCRILTAAGVDYLKTSTGFGEKGAELADIALFRQHLGEGIAIKAAGGIRTKEEMEAFLEAGCARLGCSGAAQVLFGQEVSEYISSDQDVPDSTPMEEALDLMADELLDSIPGLHIAAENSESAQNTPEWEEPELLVVEPVAEAIEPEAEVSAPEAELTEEEAEPVLDIGEMVFSSLLDDGESIFGEDEEAEADLSPDDDSSEQEEPGLDMEGFFDLDLSSEEDDDQDEPELGVELSSEEAAIIAEALGLEEDLNLDEGFDLEFALDEESAPEETSILEEGSILEETTILEEELEDKPKKKSLFGRFKI